jgi:predicted kinase
VGERILQVYCDENQDRVSAALMNFYQSYRACVRAKVATLAAIQATSPARSVCLDRARSYLSLADKYASRLGPPAAIIVSGLMGSGKSTMAQALAESLGAELLQTDLVRRELLGTSNAPSGFNEGHYVVDQRDRIYDEMFRRASDWLKRGVSIVLDGTFATVRHRERALIEARLDGAVVLMVRCKCNDQTAMERIAQRAAAGSSPSEARPELYEQQKSAFESDPPGMHALEVDTSSTLRVQELAVLERLQHALAEAGSVR